MLAGMSPLASRSLKEEQLLLVYHTNRECNEFELSFVCGFFVLSSEVAYNGAIRYKYVSECAVE